MSRTTEFAFFHAQERRCTPLRQRPFAAIALSLLMLAGSGVSRSVQAQVRSASNASESVSEDAEPLGACVASLRRELPRHPEVRPEVFDRLTGDLTDLRPVIRAASRSQPEFKLAVWDYLARLVDDQRVAEGRAVLALQAAPLAAIARRHGVDPATVVAVFGVETDYGKVGGKYPVLDATLSRACLDLGSSERKRHFFAALWLLQEGKVEPDTFRGSWAGAFGLTQFMPGTFVTYMDGSDGPGPVDIVGKPADALATTANFIAGSGWVRGLHWSVEARGPKPVIREMAAAEREHGCLANAKPGGKCRSLAQWAALGVVPVEPAVAAMPSSTRAALLAPSGEDGPVWLVTANFQALWTYNRADSYALAIGLLSNALRDEPPMATPWPTDDPGLSRRGMRELQQALVDHGHADVTPDGFDGPLTRDAVRAEQARLGLPVTGAGRREDCGGVGEWFGELFNQRLIERFCKCSGFEWIRASSQCTNTPDAAAIRGALNAGRAEQLAQAVTPAAQSAIALA